MCGIAGFVVAGERAAEPILDRQLALLRHRGPDACGGFTRGCGSIGQNRLAVIDLDTGDPPIVNETGSIGAVLNGEIYNYQTLRHQLSHAGHRMSTRGDTEVLAHLAEDQEPAEFVRRLDGMFAFAIWDEPRGQLVLGRDRVGKKPLYYWEGGGTLVFASELKAVLAHPLVPRELDEDALPAYLTFGYVPTPRTFYAGIRSLAPGTVLMMKPGATPLLERYWAPPERRQAKIRVREAPALVRAAIDRAVGKRLIADVPVGAFLSGGVDSSAVVASMARQVEGRGPAFTIGFDDRDGYVERPYARLVASRYGTEHHEFVVKPDAVELVDRILWHHDQPFGDSSAVPTFLLSELTHRHVKVALSGDGGDELFAGYERFAADLLARRYAQLPSGARLRIRSFARHTPSGWRRASSLKRFLDEADQGLPDAYRGWVSFLKEPERHEAISGQNDWALEDYERTWQLSADRKPLDRLLDLNLRTYLPDDLLVKADRMSMAHSLEVRSPLLDRELLELAVSLPPLSKVAGMELKMVLKAAVATQVPREILRRRKRGFGVPLDRWFREDLKSYMTAQLKTPQTRVRQHLRGSFIDRVLDEHERGLRNHGQVLWMLLMLELFLRREGW